MTPGQLKLIMPRADAALFTPILNAAFQEFGINDAWEQAAFLGNIGAETGELNTFSENLNYSAGALLTTWPARFTPTLASEYARRPEAIANFVYGGRFGNGDAKSGDGWRYRGGGGIQITFKSNYETGAKRFGMTVDKFAAWVRTPEGAIRSAADFWRANKIGARAAIRDFDGCCDLVNIGKKTIAVGDAHGYPRRREIFERALQVLL